MGISHSKWRGEKMEQKEVLYSVKEGIGRIVINRPEKKNALNMRTRQRLVEIMDEAARDENTQVVVITGSGEEAFISGADLNEMKDLTALQMLRYIETYGQKLYNNLNSIPTIALAKGTVWVEMQLRWPVTSHRISDLFISQTKHGVIPGGEGTETREARRPDGQKRYSHRQTIDATEAERSLINKVVPRIN
jgi:enoyl-CoA hydratase